MPPNKKLNARPAAAVIHCELAKHEEARFAALVERQSRFLFRVAYAVLRNVFDAEDVVQETFLKLYRTGAWENARDERAFLARTVWRMASDRIPKRSQQPLDPELVSLETNPEDAAMAADWNATVHRLIDALPEELRQPLALTAVEMTSPEIAAMMETPEGTVRTRIQRARRILKEKLAGLMEARHARS